MQITHGYNGYLVDETEAAAAHTLQLLQNRALWHELSANAYETVRQRFLFPALILDYLKALQGAQLTAQRKTACCKGVFPRASWRGRATPIFAGNAEAIGGGGAHGEQLAPNLLGELQMPMLLQGVDQVGQERDHAFGDIPGQEQSVLDFWPIMARMRVHRFVQHILSMVEQSHP